MTSGTSNERWRGGSAQGTLVLSTKVHAPRLRVDGVRRERLLERLRQAGRSPVTLVTAPAGFGKSTLVASWTRELESPSAWVSLDEGDNDPTQFWTYVTASLEASVPDFRCDAMEILQASSRPEVASVLVELLNGLAASSSVVVLVLDDYHLIENSAIHAAVSFLIDHAPPELRLVLATRHEPPLPLARLRANGDLLEITSADLRTTEQEAGAFLTHVMKIELAPEDVRKLAARTEGWWAGLQLAALSLRTSDDPARLVDSFRGDNRYVLDYLTDEVVRQQSDRVQRFLFDTSILPRLCGPLCNAVTGRADGQEMLEHLEVENLFIVPLDDARRWYRYHALFADVLRRRLSATRSTDVTGLHRRAAAWHESVGHVAEALRHYRAANEIAPAARLIGRTITSTTTAQSVRVLMGWLEGLPSEIAQAFPRLTLARVVVSMLAENPDVIEALLDPADPARPDVRIEVDRIAALVESPDAAGMEPTRGEANPWLSGTIALGLGTGSYYRGRWRHAMNAFHLAYRLLEAADYRYGMLVARMSLADVLRQQGRLDDATREYEVMLELARDPAGPLHPVGGHALIGLAKIRCERWDLAAAERLVLEGLEAGSEDDESVVVNGHLTLALVRRLRGDREEALRALDRADEVGRRHGMTQVVKRADAFRTQVRLDDGDVAAALAWTFRCGLSPADTPSRMEHAEYLTFALVLAAEGRHAEATDLLARLAGHASAQGRLAHRLEASVVHAACLEACGRAEDAADELALAVRAAAPEGYVRPFLLHGRAVHGLLGSLPPLDEAEAHRRRLLAAFGDPTLEGGRRWAGKAEARTPRGAGASPRERLSGRETTVMRLLVGGMSNKELARELDVTVNTVKTHVRNVYAKLGVNTRAQLVARVHELDLL